MRFCKFVTHMFALLAIAAGLTIAPIPTVNEPTPAYAGGATVIHSNERVNVSLGVFIPCTSEFVVLKGPLHFQNNVVINGNGFSSEFITNPQGLKGTGTLGTNFIGAGKTGGGFRLTGQLGLVNTFTNIFFINGAGSTRYQVHQNTNFVVDANGNVRATPLNAWVTCV